MKNLDSFFGRNVSYSKKKSNTYKKLQSDPLSPFKDKTMAEIFVYAAIFGFSNKRKAELKDPVPQISAVAFSNKQKAVLLTTVISDTQGIDILFAPDDAIEMVEQYANGGIDLLESQLLGDIHADAITKMSSAMKEILDNSPSG